MNISQTPVHAPEVRIGLSIGMGKREAVYVQYAAVQPEPMHGGTHMSMQRGDLRRGFFSRDWTAEPTVARNFAEDPLLAKQVSSAIHDAYRAFLALGIVPNGGPSVTEAPDLLTIDSDAGRWSFARTAAPSEAWAMYLAAGKVLLAGKPAPDPNDPDAPAPDPVTTVSATS